MLNLRKIIQHKVKYSFILAALFLASYLYYNLLSLHKKNDDKYLVFRDLGLRSAEYLLNIPTIIVDEFAAIGENLNLFWQTYDQNKSLLEQNNILANQLIDYEILKSNNIELKQMLDYASENISKQYSIYKVIGYNTSDGVKELFIATGGRKIREGKLIFNKSGVIGRAIACGDHYAKVILISDEISSIPAQTLAGDRFTVSGYRSGFLQIKYLDHNSTLNIGDLVLSSGEADLIDDNIPIGRVVSYENNQYLIRSFVDLSSLRFVFIYNE